MAGVAPSGGEPLRSQRDFECNRLLAAVNGVIELGSYLSVRCCDEKDDFRSGPADGYRRGEITCPDAIETRGWFRRAGEVHECISWFFAAVTAGCRPSDSSEEWGPTRAFPSRFVPC